MISRFICILAAIILLLAREVSAQSCDVNKECVGNALTIDNTKGKLAQYVDVDTSYLIRQITDAITFEAWIKPEPQPGKKIFVAGLWGPNRDNNDQWMVYLQGNTINIELSADNSFQGSADNTLAQATLSNLYSRGWLHLAATWDVVSGLAKIYVDGYEVASSNQPFAIPKLKVMESKTLPVQIGSTNALFDDTTNYRAFLGQMDEIRLWNRSLTQPEIFCQRNQSLGGKESGLVFYYRANEDAGVQDLCDATGQDIGGRMRSGARTTPSDRRVLPTFSVSPTITVDTLVCASTRSYDFVITDTTVCGSRVNVTIRGPDAGLFSLSRNVLQLVEDVPQSITLSVNAILIGDIQAELVFDNVNRCGEPVVIPINLTRRTELSYSFTKITFDTLIAGCIEQKFLEQTLRICNTTGKNLQIFSTSLDNNRFTLRPADPSKPLPYTLGPKECWELIVRFDAQDTTKTWFDTLRVASDESCVGGGIIPIYGHTQEVLGLLEPDGKTRIRPMTFGAVCPGQTSNPETYQYRNLLKTLRDTVFIENIEFTPGFIGFNFKFPLKLVAQRAYQPTFVRARPIAPGPYSGEMKITARFRGCTIVKTVPLSGRGISVDVRFNAGLIGFGNVTIGKTSQQSVAVENFGLDARKMSAYFKVGDVFSFVNSKTFNIGPSATQNVNVLFRPREKKTYYDTLCIFDEQCYETQCIPISGTGVFDAIEFNPAYAQIENVVGCQCGETVVNVKNVSGVTRSIISDRSIDPSGKFTLLTRATPGSFANNASFDYTVRYCPNDMRDDRNDEAFIEMVLDNGDTYELVVRGSSAAPRVYVTPLTTFNVVEVGWTKTDRVLVENISAVPVRISSITAPAGYRITAITPAIPHTLAPRDSLWVDLIFEPKVEQSYNGQLMVTIDSPCTIPNSGQLTGEGKVAKLQVPITFVNYSLIKPCDCAEREIPLYNTSFLQDLTIDSIWIDGLGVTPQTPSIYTWRSKRSGTTLPYTIPPQSSDTLVVTFCPDIPATKANQIKNDTIHITARSPGWSDTFEALLSGRREINFSPSTDLIQFPATRVDTTLGAVSLELSVPNAFSNPSGDSVVVTNITFKPDQRVFTARAASGAPLPWVIRRNEKFEILVDFRPRAPRDYEARMQIHTSFPCIGVDTTVLVRGSGFAPAFGLQMAFDTNAVGRDTIRLTTCDTLTLPVMITREIPQPLIDMLFRIQYDSTYLRLLDVITPYTSQATARDTGDGARMLLKNAVNVPAGTFAYVRFVVINSPAQFPIILDEIDFDSDSLVNFKIIAGLDKGFVIIDRPMIEISALTAFDTVHVKTCEDQTVWVTNPGAIPVRFDSLSSLPRWHRVTASSVPLPATLQPGDTVRLTVSFCPLDEVVNDTTTESLSTLPCAISDTARITSVGYAPPFPLTLQFDSAAVTIDSVHATISDTVTVPIYVDRDIILSPIDLRFEFQYNNRALQFLEATSSYGSVQSQFTGSGISLTLEDCDSVRAGVVALLRFRVAVPDSIMSEMTIAPGTFTSDSVMFVKPVPMGDTATMHVLPKCNVNRMNFVSGQNELGTITPNPASGIARVEFEFFEHLTPTLHIYNEMGALVADLLRGNNVSEPGRYIAEFDTRSLASGTYHYVYKVGRFVRSTKLMIVR